MSEPRAAMARIALSHWDKDGNRIQPIEPAEIEIGMVLYGASTDTGDCDGTRYLVFKVRDGLAQALVYRQDDTISEVWGIGYQWYDHPAWTYHTHEEVHD